jgi:ATP-binding cassette subfamily B protein
VSAPREGILDQAQASAGPVRGGELARLVAAALRIVWRSSRRDFVAVVACSLLIGAGSSAQVLLAGHIAGRALSGSAAGAAVAALLPGVIGLVVVTAAVALVSAVARERQRVVGELVAKSAQAQVLQVAAGVRLEEFERPEFYDRLQRATLTAMIRPAQLASGLLGAISAGLSCAGVAVGLLFIDPLLGGCGSRRPTPTRPSTGSPSP